ncbi:thiamine pyrophosphate-dependent enzyme [Nocardia sp. CDC160]|uniref:thiamine pyrophosphate-dependent enzyme n=1 Tax=Nocardia sp. CDC160 TaxID=3112166 RepID=UPI002DBE372D|nr:thiamine pyrophosphate-dependent enzyme [Nocardia sp. CDC160]MEC3919974.1 thiamine pyrophosphate-dependent enzyme [Nocardia sp. CDC160]
MPQMNPHLGADLLGRPRFADALVDRLVGNDVRYLFGMPAESVNCLVDAVGRRAEIDLIAVRHESAASWMAVGYARRSGTVGVCFGTAGPGATHLLPGVYDGLYDRVPVLAISGQVGLSGIGTQSFQEIDSTRLFRDGTWRSADLMSADQIGVFDQIMLAIRLERTSAHVAIPSDLLHSPVDATEAPSPYRLDRRSAVEVDKKRVDDLADHLCAHPMTIVLGSGSAESVDRARVLAAALGARLVALPESGIPEALVNPVEDEGAAAADDTVLVIGRPTVGVRRYFPAAENLIEITDLATSGFDTGARRVGIAGDIPAILESLAAAVSSRRDSPARAALAVPRHEDLPDGWAVLAQRLEGASVAVDPGPVQRLSRRFLSAHADIHSAWNLQAEGSALPMAIGLALAANDRCYALTELGSLDQYISELSTAVRYAVPVTVVCVAESGATVRDLASAFGIQVFWAEDPAALAASLDEAGQSGGPAVILTSALEPESAPVESTPAPEVVRYTNDLLEAVAAHGVDSVYVSRTGCARTGLTGATPAGLDLRVVSDIQAAAMRATAACKASGTTAGVLVTSPAELLGQLNGLYDAAFDSASVLLISVEIDRWFLDPVEVLGEISAISVVLEGGDQDAARLRAALLSVAGGGKGVTHIHLTRAALSAGNGAALVESTRSLGIPASLIGLPGSTVAAPEEIARAAQLLAAAGNVSIVVGRGARGARPELLELASRLGAPLYGTMGALAANVLGEHCDGLVGTSGHDEAMQRIRRSDLVLLIGVSWRGSAFELVGSGPVISINADPLTFLRLPPESIGLLGDARAMLEALIGSTKEPAAANIPADTATPRRDGPRENSRPLRAATVAQIIDHELARTERASTLSVDVGINTLWAYRFVRSATRYLWTASFATMGFAVPAAIDAAVRNPHDISVAIVGDGGIAITLAELRNAARLESPTVIVVFNNGALAAIKFESWIMGWPDTSSEFAPCDFASFARHCGVAAVTARTSQEFGIAFRNALRTNGATLIDARIPAVEAPALAGRIHPRQVVGLVAGWVRDGKSARSGAWSMVKAVAADAAGQAIRRVGQRE